MRLCAPLAFAFAVLLASHFARADELSVRTIEFGSWPAAVASLEGNLQSEGRVIHVFVRDDGGRPVACGDYTLMLDAIAERAFTLGRCDSVTSSTEVRLVNRHALFAHDDFLPRPLPAGISAVEVRTTGVSGGAGHVGGSELQCTLALRPFLTNLETGEHAFLPPGRFALRVLSHDVDAMATQRGWTLQAHTHGQLTIEYEVHDTVRHESVLHDRVTMQCGAESPAAPVPNTDDPFARIDPSRVPAPAVREGGSSCADAPLFSSRGQTQSTTHGGARVPVFRVDVGYGTTMRLHLNTSFGGELLWFRGCARNGPPIMSGVFGGGGDQIIRFPLDRGTYYLAIVDADIHQHDGVFSMSYEAAPDVSFDDFGTPAEMQKPTAPERRSEITATRAQDPGRR